ncbi:MAG TPA: response regulator transcription factor [Solirubrobacterales bacterium]|nr:response regulator transcription factor [Solirubrobacterales bacterium]
MDAARACLVIDTQPLIRIGIASLLEPEYETEGVGGCDDAVELLATLGDFDVAVLGMRSERSNGSPSGPGAIRELLRVQPGLGIVALGQPLERHAVRVALDAGAAAYVGRSSEPAALRRAVDAAADQEAYIDPATARASRGELTRRQREVLQLFADGLGASAIAQRLGLSEQTVRTHAKAGITRIGARDRSHAVALAMRGSLIE